MKSTLTRRTYATLILFALGAVYFLGAAQPAVQAGTAKTKVPGVSAKQIPSGTVGPAVAPAHTVYMDGSGGKKNAAKNMTALHEVMAAKGWTFAHLAPHLENNDLQGWWITYVVR